MSTGFPPPPGVPGPPPPPPGPGPVLPPPPGAAPESARGRSLPRATWRAVEAIPVYVIALVATVAVAVVGGAFVDDRDVLTVVAQLGFDVALPLAVVLWIRVVHHTPLGVIGLPGRPLPDAGFGTVSGVVTYLGAFFAIAPVVVLVWEAFTGRSPTPPEQIPTDLTGGALVALSVLVLVGAPVAEELFFRGFLFGALRARRGFLASAIISGAAFGLVHYLDGNWILVPIMTFVGIALAWIYERRGSILAPMAAHFTFNVIGLTVILATR